MCVISARDSTILKNVLISSSLNLLSTCKAHSRSPSIARDSGQPTTETYLNGERTLDLAPEDSPNGCGRTQGIAVQVAC